MPKKNKFKCKFCSNYGIRISKYDAVACKNCMIWLDRKCGDPDCEFCKDRPISPIDVNWDDPFNIHY